MDGKDIQAALLTRLGLRVDDEMAQYIARQMKNPSGDIPILGGDARTGTPLMRVIPLSDITRADSVLTPQP